ncbi:MAG: protein-disulfide isomerase [Patiriisocius sp.]|jgi:protein-disulfide isomerase
MDNSNQTVVLAGAILLGFAMVAGAIFFAGMPGGSSATAVAQHGGVMAEQGPVGDPKRSDDAPRNIYGNPDAEITIVEFSDFECPFCARLHPTLTRVIDESEGTINWEYRHLPLSIHANAEPSAIASECVAQLAGNDAFWEYSESILGNQRGLTAAFLESTATAQGVDAAAYKKCIVSDEIAQLVQSDTQAAIALGGSGTPFNVVEFADGTTRVASGALPYENWKALLSN